MPVTGGVPTQLNGGIPPAAVADFEIAPNSAWVVYIAPVDDPSFWERVKAAFTA